MTRKSKLLVPLDGSSPADGPLQVAQAIADLMQAEIDVLYVAHEPISLEDVARKARVPASWLPRVGLHQAVGHAATGILAVAREIGADAIMLSSHGVTHDLNVPAGHVTLGVLEDPPCPVYVVRSAMSTASQAHRLRHLRRILVPLDGTAEAAQSVEHAAALAVRARARLHLLHVIGAEPRRAKAGPVYSDQYYHEMEAWVDEFLRSSFARAPRPPEVQSQVALRCGDPGQEIAMYASDEDCDLIVAAWGGRLSPGRAMVIRALLGASCCPILFLRATAAAPSGSGGNASGKRR